jgi:hypothetical protein
MGYRWKEALTLGKAVAGLNAQSKGRRLGIYGPPKGAEEGKPPKKVGLGEDFWLECVGRAVPVKQTEEGVRAVVKDQPIDPESVARYLGSRFGDELADVRAAMTKLAASYEKAELPEIAYELYEKFRPAIARGKRGWGQKGTLDLDVVESLSKGK